MRYQVRVFRLPEEAHEDLVATLHHLGALGFEVGAADADGRLRLDAWCPDPAPAGFAAFDLERPPFVGGRAWSARGVVEEARRRVDEEDWLAPYRARSQPLAIGGGFIVDPRDPEDGDGAGGGDRVLAIPAQNAFGTGSHETTRLAVAWLLELAAGGELAGRRLLDVGTGSGILAFVAERLGAAVVGLDVDPASVVTARANARRNRCAPRLLAGRPAALRGPAFDLALVNVLPERILGDYPRILELLRPDPGVRIVSSGNLATQRHSLLRRFADLGLRQLGERVDGEWIAWLLAPAGAGR